MVALIKALYLRLVFVFLLLLFFVGCAHRAVWYSQNKNTYETQQDYRECNYDKTKYGYVPMRGSGVGTGIEQGMRDIDIMKGCMQSKGYQLTNKESLESQNIPFVDLHPFP